MNRHQYTTPGHDCIANPCGRNGCGTRPGSGHGRGSEIWWYVVGYGSDAALVLKVNANSYPNGYVYPDGRPEGWDLSLHVSYRTDREQVRTDSEPAACTNVAVGRCYIPYSVASFAHEFFDAHGRASGPDQPESFWEAMEAHYRVVVAKYPRIDYVRCSHCDGTGTVPGGER